MADGPTEVWDCPDNKCPQQAMTVPRLKDDWNRVKCGCGVWMVKRVPKP